MKVNTTLTPSQLVRKIERLWELSAGKILAIEKEFDAAKGSPVFTAEGRYTDPRLDGMDARLPVRLGDPPVRRHRQTSSSWRSGAAATLAAMAPHVGHFGVHDHGFNNVSTYGNLLRLMGEGRIPADPWERCYYELALKLSGAIQARRWTKTRNGGGFIYSFNGPHSLFVDTIRSLRALAMAHKLGHAIWEENDRKISLLGSTARPRHRHGHALGLLRRGPRRLRRSRARGPRVDLQRQRRHATAARTPSRATPRSPPGRAAWPGPCAGSPSNWSSWPTCECRDPADRGPTDLYLKAARATCDFYIEQAAASDGIPYWDTGAPHLHKLGDWQGRPADPFNAHEPVDSSAAAIAAQGLLRLGHFLRRSNKKGDERWCGSCTAAPGKGWQYNCHPNVGQNGDNQPARRIHSRRRRALRLRRSSNRAPVFRTMACPINAA